MGGVPGPDVGGRWGAWIYAGEPREKRDEAGGVADADRRSDQRPDCQQYGPGKNDDRVQAHAGEWRNAVSFRDPVHHAKLGNQGWKSLRRTVSASRGGGAGAG